MLKFEDSTLQLPLTLKIFSLIKHQNLTDCIYGSFFKLERFLSCLFKYKSWFWKLRGIFAADKMICKSPFRTEWRCYFIVNKAAEPTEDVWWKTERVGNCRNSNLKLPRIKLRLPALVLDGVTMAKKTNLEAEGSEKIFAVQTFHCHHLRIAQIAINDNALARRKWWYLVGWEEGRGRKKKFCNVFARREVHSSARTLQDSHKS